MGYDVMAINISEEHAILRHQGRSSNNYKIIQHHTHEDHIPNVNMCIDTCLKITVKWLTCLLYIYEIPD